MTDLETRKNSCTPLISVALPVYNGGEHLKLALQSILSQSYPTWELFLIDDGSTDGAIDALASIDDPRVNIVQDHKNLGLAVRLNQAIGMANGKYFARMDADDICHQDRFLKQVGFLESHADVDLIATRVVTIDEENRLNGSLPFSADHSEICKTPWKGFYMPHPTWMGRLSWFRMNHYQEPSPYLCEDQELLLRTYGGSKFYTLPFQLLAYRVRTNPPLIKKWRVRLSLLKMQLGFFISQKNSVNALLSMLTFFLRVLADIVKKIFQMFRMITKRSPSGNLAAEDAREWQAYIDKISAKAQLLTHEKGETPVV